MSLLQMAKDLTVAQISSGLISDGEVLPFLEDTFKVLQSLEFREQFNMREEGEPVPVNWKASIKQKKVICLECGQGFKILGHWHLRHHALDGNSYREKYGIPKHIPLSAKQTTARRREVAKSTRPWENAPAYLKSQQTAIASRAMYGKGKVK